MTMLTYESCPPELAEFFPEIYPQEDFAPLPSIEALDFNTWSAMDTLPQENSNEQTSIPLNLEQHLHDFHEQAVIVDSPLDTCLVEDNSQQKIEGEDHTDTPSPNAGAVTQLAQTIKPPEKKPRAKGRSLGENSSNSVKLLREQASNGDVNAALKLGWSVSRVTEIFNKNKASRGEKVAPGQAIDDEVLLEQLKQRRRYQAHIQQKRQRKLRELANQGDFAAAKKLKFGKRKMEELFPNMVQGEDQDVKGATQAAGEPSTTPEIGDIGEADIDIERAKTPGQPFDYAQECLPLRPAHHDTQAVSLMGQMQAEPVDLKPVAGLEDAAGLSYSDQPNMSSSWNTAGINGLPSFNELLAGNQSLAWQEQNAWLHHSPSYPMAEVQVSPQMSALHWEYIAAQEHVKRVKQKIDDLKAAELRAAEERAAALRADEVRAMKARAAADRRVQMIRSESVQTPTSKKVKKIKGEKSISRKGRKLRLSSNFPPESADEKPTI